MRQPDLTRAAERYLEQCGEPLVMNTYLKIAVLALCAICVALAALVYRSQNTLAAMRPMIVRINDVGRAEAIDYRIFNIARRKLRTNITCRAGRNSTSAGTASRSSGTR